MGQCQSSSSPTSTATATATATATVSANTKNECSGGVNKHSQQEVIPSKSRYNDKKMTSTSTSTSLPLSSSAVAAKAYEQDCSTTSSFSASSSHGIEPSSRHDDFEMEGQHDIIQAAPESSLAGTQEQDQDQDTNENDSQEQQQEQDQEEQEAAQDISMDSPVSLLAGNHACPVDPSTALLPANPAIRASDTTTTTVTSVTSSTNNSSFTIISSGKNNEIAAARNRLRKLEMESSWFALSFSPPHERSYLYESYDFHGSSTSSTAWNCHGDDDTPAPSAYHNSVAADAVDREMFHPSLLDGKHTILGDSRTSSVIAARKYSLDDVWGSLVENDGSDEDNNDSMISLSISNHE